MTSFNFTELGPDLILDAIESIGIYPESGLTPLNSYENRVYQFRAEDSLKYVVKFYRPLRWSKAQILEEHEYCFALIEDGLPIAAPKKINGQSLFEYNGFTFCIYPSLGGRMFELDNLDQLEWLGRLIGRMHKSGQNQRFQHRNTIDIESELTASKQTLVNCPHIPDYIRHTFFHDLDMLIDRTLEQTKTNYQTIKLHGDCHTGNILWQQDDSKSDAILLDFDDCISGPAVQDLWMMLNGDRQQKLLQLDTMVGAYEEFCDFNRAELTLIEPLRSRRIINYMAWLATRWQDPAFPRNFSWFATDKYWEQQVLSLKEQISALAEPSLNLQPFS